MGRRWDWLELSLAVVFGIAGLLQIGSPPQPGSPSAIMPDLWRIVWLVMMCVGCLAVVCGALWPRVSGYYVESVGLLAMGLSISLNGLQVLVLQLSVHSPVRQLVLGGMLIIGLGAGLLLKWHQLNGDIKKLPKVGGP